MQKVVFELSDAEVIEIRQLYEKKVALENLINIVNPSNDDLYARVTTDYTNALSLFQKWWHDMSIKYHWEQADGGHWVVNFDTGEILLVQ